LTHVLVRLADPNQLDAVVNQLRGCDAGSYMNVVPLAHLFRTIQGVVSSTRLLLGCLAAVALLVAAAGVSNSLLMAVTERTREIGVLRALGASRGQIFRLFWLETLGMCLAEPLPASSRRSSLRDWWNLAPIPLTLCSDRTVDSLARSIVITCLACALIIGSAAGLLPAWRAGLLSPSEAMRRGGCG